MSTVTEGIGQFKPAGSKPVQILMYVTLVGALAGTAFYAPGLIRFWPFSAAEFVPRFFPLFLISLFIERAIEVFVSAWRGPEAAIRDRQMKELRKAIKEGKGELISELARLSAEKEYCRSRMQRIAFASSVGLGILISSVGVRALGLFVDPVSFGALSPKQQASFNMVDVLLTGATLGGGSDALHKFVSVFTNFMERTAKQAKGDAD
jgi:hypothetical protein